MAEKNAPTPQTPAEDTVPKFRKAVEWAVTESLAKHGGHCGVCTWRPWDMGTEAQTRQSLTQHIRRKHRDSIVDLYDKQLLDLSAARMVDTPLGDSDDELLSAAGINEVRDLDHIDMLAIPQAERERMESDGSTPRWVRRERVDHFKAQGARLIHAEGSFANSTEDGILKANEMVCVELPHELAQRRSRQKSARVQDGLSARAEEIRQIKSEGHRRAYETMRGRGADHQTANQVAGALVRRAEREAGGPATMIRDRHGETEL